MKALVILAMLNSIVFSISYSKNLHFKRIDLSDSNKVRNETNIQVYDTIVKLGLRVLELDSIHVVIKPLKEIHNQNPDLNLLAAVYKNKNGYVMLIDTTQRSSALRIISHELIHLKQYEDLDLAVANHHTVVWKGEPYYVEGLDYFLRPWELQAFYEERSIAIKVKKYTL